MSEKEKDATKDKDIDLSDFEFQIDKEIDSLFVPTGRSAGVDDLFAEPVAESKDAPVESEPTMEPFFDETPPSPAVETPSWQSDTEQKFGASMEKFEIEIDREIDSLFMPAGAPAVSSTPESTITEPELVAEKLETSEPDLFSTGSWSAPAAETPVAEKKPGLDFDSLESKIELEIDSLFVPAEDHAPPSYHAPELPLDEPRAPVTFAETPIPAPEPEPEPVVAAPAFEPRKEVEFDLSFEPAPPGPVEEIKPFVEPVPEPPAGDLELKKLVEGFNVAYLSLDWEFSAENISSFENALLDLQPLSDKSVAAQSVFKILRAVVKRLRMQPKSVNPQIIEFVRDGQEVFKDVLAAGEQPNREQKEKVKNLIGRFQDLKEKEKPAPVVPTPVEVKVEEPELIEPLTIEPPPVFVETPPPAVEIPVAVVETPAAAVVEERMTDGLREWIASYRSHIMQCVSGLEAEQKLLFQIEQILKKTKALEPLTVRLGSIRANLEHHITSFKAKDREWMGDLVLSHGISSLPEVKVDTETPTWERADVTVAVEPAAAAEAKRDQVYYFSVSGRKFAVLASQLVKIDRISTVKVKTIEKRGYAVLSDFKKLFRGITAGLFGAWGGMPADVLKSYRFLPMPGEVFGAPGPVSKIGGMLMLSSGRNHGIIFTDSASIDFHSDIEIFRPREGDGAMLGIIRSESGEIGVIDIDGVFRKMGRDTGA